ncbi:Endoribonuclease L-PSP [Scleroderma citrinum]
MAVNEVPEKDRSKVIVLAPDAVPPLPVFSQAVISGGNVYVSGCIGCDDEYNVVGGGIHQQTRAALENLSKILVAAGSGMEHVVKATVYLAHMARDFEHMNEVYQEFFPPESPLPARTCIGVSALYMGAFVEVDCIAVIP